VDVKCIDFCLIDGCVLHQQKWNLAWMQPGAGFGDDMEARMPLAEVKITILVDNHAGAGLLEEHGLSFWIEAGGKRILFDTGQGKALAQNARTLGVDLGTTDTLVLSHGHYDHTGGIPHVLRLARNPEVYCHPGVVQPRYAIRDGRSRSIQMPSEAMTAIDGLPPRCLHWACDPVLLAEDIGITGQIPRKYDCRESEEPFFLDPEGKRSDPVADDLALWMRKDDGLVVVVGCAHAGLVNTLDYVRQLHDGMKIRAVIGGFHLGGADRDRITRTLDGLRPLLPEMLVPCHCTGDQAVAMLQEAYGDRVAPGAAGMTLLF
jgi:7,8-dihydropterin-6-yl-methyl-4-(beta-D-ribofuranosyl)aminobenzene 5'-phosphate synthase